MFYNIIVLLLLAVSITVEGQRLDRTLLPGSNGSDVVRAVISKIIFSDHVSFVAVPEGVVALFMQTMAFVETRDGTKLNQNEDRGGIWMISEASFSEARLHFQGDDNQRIKNELQEKHPHNHIGPIDWDNIMYDNLTIPLYSGLVVRILIHLSSDRLDDLPVDRHSEYWNRVFKNRLGDMQQWNRDVTDLSRTEAEGTIYSEVL